MKNNGFYVGAKEDWITPANFSKEDYDKGYECVSILEKAILPLFELPISDEEFINYLNRNTDNFL